MNVSQEEDDITTRLHHKQQQVRKLKQTKVLNTEITTSSLSNSSCTGHKIMTMIVVESIFCILCLLSVKNASSIQASALILITIIIVCTVTEVAYWVY